MSNTGAKHQQPRDTEPSAEGRPSRPDREQAPPQPATEDDHVEHEIEIEALPDDVVALLRILEQERDEALAARQRTLADYSNFQRRSAGNEAMAQLTGAAGVVRSIIPVLDNFELALGQSLEKLTVGQLTAGMALVRDELQKVLETHGVTRIEPEVGCEFDPNRHEAMLRQAAPGLPPNAVARVLQPGYVMGDHVLRPAKVIVVAPSAPPEEASCPDEA